MLKEDMEYINELENKITEIDRDIKRKKRICYISLSIILLAQLAVIGKDIYDEEYVYIQEDIEDYLKDVYEKVIYFCDNLSDNDKVKTK